MARALLRTAQDRVLHALPAGTDTVVSTSLEAFACSAPVSSYRCIPGHGLTNAAALNEAGAAVWIRDPADLTAVRFHLIGGPLGRRQRATGFALFAQSPDGCPTAEIARGHRSGAPDRGFRPAAQRHRTKRRLAATAVLASVVCASAVATGVATAYDSPDLHPRHQPPATGTTARGSDCRSHGAWHALSAARCPTIAVTPAGHASGSTCLSGARTQSARCQSAR
ncbi:hypothetical protein [Streptomyces stelliscabiei]|uniref:hypothetical protein n=1 Tax=Streptomyces stelliscabiei TaxID=146820 RepID=UPI003A933B69